MMIVKRKTSKAIRKSVNRVIKKHGPRIAAGLAGGIASALATLASTEAPGRKGRKSNLGALSQQVTDALAGDVSSESRKKGRASKHTKKSGRRAKKGAQESEEGETSL